MKKRIGPKISALLRKRDIKEQNELRKKLKMPLLGEKTNRNYFRASSLKEAERVNRIIQKRTHN